MRQKRERERCIYIYMYIYININIYIYVNIWRSADSAFHSLWPTEPCKAIPKTLPVGEHMIIARLIRPGRTLTWDLCLWNRLFWVMQGSPSLKLTVCWEEASFAGIYAPFPYCICSVLVRMRESIMDHVVSLDDCYNLSQQAGFSICFMKSIFFMCLNLQRPSLGASS